MLFPANFLSSSQDQGRLHLSDRYICVCVYTYVFNWSLIEGFGVWNMPESLKVAWVQWAPEALLRGSVRWLQRLLQRQRTWDEAPGVKLWRTLCYRRALPALRVRALWWHPMSVPLVIHWQYPFLSVGNVPLTATAELHLAWMLTPTARCPLW